jgi:hypothetical protein
MPTWPEWLKNITLAVVELVKKRPRAYLRFQRMIVEAEETEKRESKGLSMGGRRLVQHLQNGAQSGGMGSGVLPVRALSLAEKYAWLAAIHDVVGERVKRFDPYRTHKHSKRGNAVRSRSGWARLKAAMAYGVRKNMIRELTDEDRPYLERMLEELARDLGAPNPLRADRGSATVVLQSVKQSVNVLNRGTSVRVNVQPTVREGRKQNGPSNGKAKLPKKPRKRAKRAEPAKSTKPELRIDDRAKLAYWGGKRLEINSHADFAVLRKLQSAGGAIVPYVALFRALKPDEIIDSVEAQTTAPQEVKEAVSHVKKAFSATGCPYHIENVRSQGYRLRSADE